MTQTTELQKVKSRIRSLSERTIEKGYTESEVLQAMNAVGRLLEQYNLSMSEIDIREAKCVTVFFDTGQKNRSGMDTCMTAMAQFLDCKVWFSSVRRGSMASARYGFFGHEADTEMAIYLCSLLKAAFESEGANFKLTEVYKQSFDRREATRSFNIGMASRLYNRFKEMKEERDAEMARAQAAQREEAKAARQADTVKRDEAILAYIYQQAEQGLAVSKAQAEAYVAQTFGISTARAADAPSYGSLVVLKGQLVEHEFANSKVKLKKTAHRKRGARDHGAHGAGQAAGNRVNLSRPISGGSRISGYLG